MSHKVCVANVWYPRSGLLHGAAHCKLSYHGLLLLLILLAVSATGIQYRCSGVFNVIVVGAGNRDDEGVCRWESRGKLVKSILQGSEEGMSCYPLDSAIIGDKSYTYR